MDILKPFDIISAPYVDLNGDVKSFSNGRRQNALFLVIAVDDGNVIACKITSQDTKYNVPDFTYTLMKDSHPFLQTTSYIQLTKPHTLGINSCHRVGEVSGFCRAHISKQLSSLFNTLSSIVALQVPLSREKYVSPNKIRQFGGVTIRK